MIIPTSIAPRFKGLLSRFQSAAPVDISGLARELGLAVIEDHTLQVGISGLIEQDLELSGRYRIRVRASDPYVRKRFTIAHEIAHFVLHRDRIGTRLIDDALYRSGLPSRAEAAANNLAAEMLMPRHLIGQYSANYGTGDPAVLASIFKVSEDAMRIRLGLTRHPQPRVDRHSVGSAK